MKEALRKRNLKRLAKLHKSKHKGNYAKFLLRKLGLDSIADALQELEPEEVEAPAPAPAPAPKKKTTKKATKTTKKKEE
jgi:ribosomal protein L12E/L44/L45/RPP1/RPP2